MYGRDTNEYGRDIDPIDPIDYSKELEYSKRNRIYYNSLEVELDQDEKVDYDFNFDCYTSNLMISYFEDNEELKDLLQLAYTSGYNGEDYSKIEPHLSLFYKKFEEELIETNDSNLAVLESAYFDGLRDGGHPYDFNRTSG